MQLRGHPLTDEAFKKGQVLTVSWDPKASYHWDSGIAIGRYLEGLKAGRLTGVHCSKCKRTVIPPRLFCEICFRPMTRFVDLPDAGTVNTYSITYVKWDRTRLETPILPAVIDIDGTTPTAGILHLLGEVDPKSIKIGMKVQAVWKEEREREGAITDIRYFKPVDSTPKTNRSTNHPTKNPATTSTM